MVTKLKNVDIFYKFVTFLELSSALACRVVSVNIFVEKKCRRAKKYTLFTVFLHNNQANNNCLKNPKIPTETSFRQTMRVEFDFFRSSRALIRKHFKLTVSFRTSESF